MADRPEIQRSMADKFSFLSTGFGASARASNGTFRDSVSDVRVLLNPPSFGTPSGKIGLHIVVSRSCA
jgi:hypothetical protein